MPSPTYQQILVASEGLFLIILLLSAPAYSLQDNWVDQIAQRVQAEQVGPQAEHYLTQLSSVRQALSQGHVGAVQREMNHLVHMVATKESGLSDASAQSLLLYISEVTPVEYLDQTTRSRFRQIREMVAFKTDSIEVIPEDSSYNVTASPQTAPWDRAGYGWMRQGRVHPIVALGAGVLALIALGVIVMVYVGLGRTASNSRSAIQHTTRTF
jgi:hypothetical protein